MKEKLRAFLPAAFLFVVFVVLFHGFLSGSNVLLGTDAPVTAANLSGWGAFVPEGWKSAPLLGNPMGATINFVRLLKALCQNGVLWNSWYHGLACLIASLFLLKHLKRAGVSAWASVLSAIAAFWIGVNLTILYAGHPAKPYIVMLFVAALIPVTKAVRGSLAHSLLWGGCVGMMFLHQPDFALFFALFAGAYYLFRLYDELGFKTPLKWMKALVPALILALIFAVGPLLSGYKAYVENSVQTQVQTPKEKWDYVTQWSFPPEESIAFIAPGYTGWRSGEPAGPYWGRMGRSAGWEQTKQGFQNFKLENMYIGIIPISFALFALFSCRRSKHRAEIIFWGAAAVVALLLSFGKFFPLYSIFYKLPVVNNVRNPNKFLQVFQVCLAILTAYGADRLLSQKSEVKSQKSEEVNSDLRSLSSENRRFFWFLVGGLGILGFWALSLTLGYDGDVHRFTGQGWPPEAAKVISQNKIAALWHASFMAAVVVAVFALFSFPRFGNRRSLHPNIFSKHWKRILAAGVVLIVAADAVLLSRHYIKEMPRSYLEANALTEFVRENLGYQRVALAQEQQLFGILKTYTLPYNGIPVFNPGDVSRMSVEYKNFLQAMQKNPLAMWEFSAVKYLLAPAGVQSQIPAQRARKVFACSAHSSQDGGFLLQADLAGPFAVFELSNTLPRYSLFFGSRKMSDEDALHEIGNLSRLSLPPDSPLPELPGSGHSGRVTVEHYRPGRVVLSVESKTDGILRCAERYAPGWTAKIDGRPVSVEPVDYICQGVFVPAGSHRVEMYYNARRGFLYLQLAGYLVFVLALIWSFRGRSDAGQFDVK